MTKKFYSMALLFCLSLLLSQCTQEEVKPSEDFVDYDLKAQAQRTDAFIIYAEVSFICQDEGCTGYDYVFEVAGTKVSLRVDWGDGAVTGCLNEASYRLEHTYAKRGRYFITVTGTLANVTRFEAGSDGLGDFRAINFAALPNLQMVDLGGIGYHAPVTIDLTKNHALKSVSAPESFDTKNLVLPHRHFINDIHIDGPSALDANDVDKIISNIYANTISRKIHGGRFSLRAHVYQDDDYAMIGPPSESSLAKLRILRDKYDWRIYPLDGRPFEWD
jgi:hypothetical protein